MVLYIFIDEAGTFVVPKSSNLVSCLAALVVPEPFAARSFRKFRKLTLPWRNRHQEVKGSGLDARKIASVVKTLRRFDVLLLAVCVDMGLHTEAEIERHKELQAQSFIEAISPAMLPTLKHDLEQLAARFRALSNQLYIQSIALTELVSDVLHASTLYYVQRLPKILGSFKWRLDAKDVAPTKYEQLWREVVASFLSFRSIKHPIPQLEDADYSAFSQFDADVSDIPEHFKNRIPNSEGRVLASDVKEIMTRNLRFCRSERYTGLQQADVLANAIRRACNGRLDREGWRELGKLMVRKEKGHNTLRFLWLGSGSTPSQKMNYDDVVGFFDDTCKRMVAAGALKRESAG